MKRPSLLPTYHTPVLYSGCVIKVGENMGYTVCIGKDSVCQFSSLKGRYQCIQFK